MTIAALTPNWLATVNISKSRFAIPINPKSAGVSIRARTIMHAQVINWVAQVAAPVQTTELSILLPARPSVLGLPVAAIAVY